MNFKQFLTESDNQRYFLEYRNFGLIFTATTMAPSKAKALSNFFYRINKHIKEGGSRERVLSYEYKEGVKFISEEEYIKLHTPYNSSVRDV